MKKALATVAALGLALLGAATATSASAQTDTSARTGLHATVTPSTPSRYQAVTSTLTGGHARTSYYCTLTIWHAGIAGGASLASTSSIVTVKTNRAGKATCHQTFIPFSGTWQGHRHYCPPTRADKRAGWKCGVGYANTNNLHENAAALFRF